MGIVVRSEKVADYPAIAETLALAFARNGRLGAGEMMLVDTMRRDTRFDPELALVAERDGRVVGHAVFSPYEIQLGTERARGAMLAPLAVHPAFQRGGIGGALLREGFARLKVQGIPFTFHMGVPEYYPRHGYDSHQFGHVCLRFAAEPLSNAVGMYEVRPFGPDDAETVCRLWREWHEGVPFAIVPGRHFLDWASPYEHVHSVVFVKGSTVRGYLRYDRSRPARMPSFLAADADVFGAMLAYVKGLCQKVPEHFDVPLHPDAAVAAERVPGPFERMASTCSAGFLRVLDESYAPIVRYREGVKDGSGAPGILGLSPVYDFD
ncbi:MAG: GNAT family N-acetyltransferase [Chitinivibrionales bacterium]|nr:GNAT family N-acetyltransferase [Chitinivibrionales bacterium]